MTWPSDPFAPARHVRGSHLRRRIPVLEQFRCLCVGLEGDLMAFHLLLQILERGRIRPHIKPKVSFPNDRDEYCQHEESFMDAFCICSICWDDGLPRCFSRISAAPQRPRRSVDGRQMVALRQIASRTRFGRPPRRCVCTQQGPHRHSQFPHPTFAAVLSVSPIHLP
jgi:hypothetical protein